MNIAHVREKSLVEKSPYVTCIHSDNFFIILSMRKLRLGSGKDTASWRKKT